MREFPSDSMRQGCQLKLGGVRQRVRDSGEKKKCERAGKSRGLDLKNKQINTHRIKGT